MFWEIIYEVNGKAQKAYPQTRQRAEKILADVKNTLISCDFCNNYEAYQAGNEQYGVFLYEETGKHPWHVTDEEQEEVNEKVLDAPFEYDKDLAYYILCEYKSLKSANEFYREVTA